MTNNHVHHQHDHDHAHTPQVSQQNERRILLAFALIGSFMLVEFIGGLYSGSLALLADAGHMLTDAAALFLAWAAFRLGRRAKDSRRTFGYLRFEVLASFINALTLLAITGWIIYEAWLRFNRPAEIMAGPMLAIAVIGLLVNVLVLWVLTRGETEQVNIRGAILHVLGDLLGSIGAIVAAVVIKLTGWTPIDPLLSVLVALLILRSTWRLLGKSVHILLEGAPDHTTPEQIAQSLRTQIAGIRDVQHIHLWQITSNRYLATLHLRLEDDSQAKAISREAEQILKQQFAIEHPTIAIDWSDEPPETSCSLDKVCEHSHTHQH